MAGGVPLEVKVGWGISVILRLGHNIRTSEFGKSMVVPSGREERGPSE